MNRKSRSRLAADWFAKLRINAQTQEVEHEDVSDVKEEVDTSVASEMAALNSEKADLSYVNTAIANATMADSDILSAVKRLDGSVSGLDADTVDGRHASELGATGGGSDRIFNLNGQTVTTSYTLPAGQNAMTAGSITVNNNVTITVPDGSSWTIV